MSRFVRRLALTAAAVGMSFGFGALPAQSQSAQVCVSINGEVNGMPVGTGETPVCVPPDGGPGVPGVPGLPVPPPIPPLPVP